MIRMREQDRLGWWLAGVLALSIAFSSSAWALDLDREIARQDVEASEVLSTLGHEHRPHKDSETGKRATKDESSMRVQLIPVRHVRR
jgi:hypothetical protein